MWLSLLNSRLSCYFKNVLCLLTKSIGLFWLECKCLVCLTFRFCNFLLPLTLYSRSKLVLLLCGQKGGGGLSVLICFLCTQAMVQWAGGGSRSKSLVSRTTRAGCTGRKRAKASWASNGRSTGLCWRRRLCTGTTTSWWVKLHLWCMHVCLASVTQLITVHKKTSASLVLQTTSYSQVSVSLSDLVTFELPFSFELSLFFFLVSTLLGIYIFYVMNVTILLVVFSLPSMLLF